MYSLAFDEEGNPLDVPLSAIGWRVKRHGGGKGRPGLLHDNRGRPLVVPLDVSIEDLRAHQCGAGAFRLEAVDKDFKALGIVAYTDLPETEEDRRESSTERTAVVAMARVLEAMQQVQAEHERTQAQLLESVQKTQADVFVKMIDRLAPPQQPDLRNVLSQMSEMQKFMRKLSDGDATAAAEPATAAAPPAASSSSGMEKMFEEFLKDFLKQGVPQFAKWVWQHMGLTPQQQTDLGSSMFGGAAVPPKPPSGTNGANGANGANGTGGTPPPSTPSGNGTPSAAPPGSPASASPTPNAATSAGSPPAPASAPAGEASTWTPGPEDLAHSEAIKACFNESENTTLLNLFLALPKAEADALWKCLMKKTPQDAATFLRESILEDSPSPTTPGSP